MTSPNLQEILSEEELQAVSEVADVQEIEDFLTVLQNLTSEIKAESSDTLNKLLIIKNDNN